ncbi:MAG: hypothetical protein ABW154_07730 [Dyella sp.]
MSNVSATEAKKMYVLSTSQRIALKSSASGTVHSPARGAYRLRNEVNNVTCFNKRTLDSLYKRKLLIQIETYGYSEAYVISHAGRAAIAKATGETA